MIHLAIDEELMPNDDNCVFSIANLCLSGWIKNRDKHMVVICLQRESNKAYLQIPIKFPSRLWSLWLAALDFRYNYGIGIMQYVSENVFLVCIAYLSRTV